MFTSPAALFVPTVSFGTPTARSANPSPLKSPRTLAVLGAAGTEPRVDPDEAPATDGATRAGSSDAASAAAMARGSRRVTVVCPFVLGIGLGPEYATAGPLESQGPPA